MMGTVEASSGPNWAAVFTAAERPDLWRAMQSEEPFRSVWPEYNHHGNHGARYFGALYPNLAEFQLLVVDVRSDEVVARGRTIPFRWDGSLEDLPHGIDALGMRAIDGEDEPTALSALSAEVLQKYQGQGLSSVVIEAMAAVAGQHGLRPLVAPVRPCWKDRYPITSIDRYVRWLRDDGLPFDPWMRVHARLGASILRAEPKSMEFTQPVVEWEQWVGMTFPEDGDYVFPGGLAPLTVKGDTGRYWEPNVWMLHEL